MRVLHLAPLWFPVARDSPGGIETFLCGLLAAQVEAGSACALIATGDSRTAAELIPVVTENLCGQMARGAALEYAYYEQHQLWLALRHAADFDLVHSHVGPHGFLLSTLPGLRLLHTWHSQVYVDLGWFLDRHPDLQLSAVSEHQATQLRAHGARRCTVIPNGIDVAAFPFSPSGGEGLLFLGRMEAPKGPDLAIEAARSLGRPLRLAGPVVDPHYFDQVVRPALDGRIEYVGVVGHAEKTRLFGEAACVLMPSRVEEAFGMAAIEAMACGTPVVALGRGALPEIVEPDVTGYVAPDSTALSRLVGLATALDRAAIRARVAARFDIGVIARRYLDLYDEVASGG
jgi:glycosyltransferase involved in cell wall biosynthesis